MSNKNIIADYPLLLKEWDYDKNKNSNPLIDVFSGRTKIWWSCENYQHSWEAILKNRINGSKCPYCAGKRILIGFNDLLTLHKNLVNSEWDFHKNNILPNTIGAGSNQKVWWKCLNGIHEHSYESAPSARLRGRSCPYCANKKVLIGFNDLATVSSFLLSEWDFDKNDFDPTEITSGSDRVIWWICPDMGHSYSVSAYKRSIGRGCSYCYGKKVDKTNSLFDNFSEIVKLWDYNKNVIDPKNITWGSSKVFNWIGKDCNHSFERSVKRMVKNPACPYCASSNATLLTGFNDLQSKYPNIAKEWDYDKNKNLIPNNILSASSQKVWWKCLKNHSWISTVSNRTTLGSGCPDCSMGGTPKTEEDFIDFVESIIDKEKVITRNRKLISPYEVDVFIPELCIAFEFNGLYWHSEEMGKDKSYHYNKWKMCKDQGVQLITIWEDDWINKNYLIKSMVSHKLGKSSAKKNYARKTSIVNLNNQLAKHFLTKNHLQGFRIACQHIGLKNIDDEIVAILSYRKDLKNNSIILERFATSETVVGGFTKLLSQLKKIAYELNCSSITTFSSHDISDGGLYKNNGFEIVDEIHGGYWYILNNQKFHRLNYSKKVFKEDDTLLYEEKLSERDLATLNKLLRVYDSGNDKFILFL